MISKQYKESIAEALVQINEAVRPQDFAKAGTLILKYFQKNGFGTAVKMPGYEPYQNSVEKGAGVRYFYNGTHSVRLNWVGMTPTSNVISSADIWYDDKNSSGGSDIHITFDKSLSLVKALPALVNVMKNPKLGTEYVFECASNTNSLLEAITHILQENSINVSLDIAQKFIDHLEDGVKIADLTKVFGNVGYKVSVQLRELYPQNFEKKGVNIFFKGSSKDIDVDKVLGSAGGVKVKVVKGPSTEKILNTPADTKLEEDGDRIVFEEQLKDLESVTKLLISGAAYSMFVAGKGGVGKTYTLEKVLHAAGKTDGDGYFKVSGSASPIGMYKALYNNRTGIVLFDDCDSALDQQEARNLLKAATDTKKERKLNWMKKGGKEFYNPDFESDGDEGEDDDGEGEERFPTNFIFTGKVIFISNLPMNKLDPDGALRTRSFIVNVDPTDLELVDYMAKLAPSIKLEDGLTLSLEERKEVSDLIKSMVGKRQGLSLRNLVRGLNIRASGIADWKNIIIRYA